MKRQRHITPGVLGLMMAAAGLAACDRAHELAFWREDVAIDYPPLYCYETIGRPDCYAEPLEGPPNRLIGTQGTDEPVTDFDGGPVPAEPNDPQLLPPVPDREDGRPLDLT